MSSAQSFSSILSNDQVLQLLALYDEGVAPAAAAARTRLDGSAVARWYRKFWQGWRPPAASGFVPTNDNSFYGPVARRAVPPPNAMPWATPARLMGGRA